MAGRISGTLLTLALLISTVPSQVFGQIIRMGPPSGEDDASKTNGFSVLKEPQAVIDALAEYDRYCEKQAWEKAFASLATAADANPAGLIPAKDGFYLPTRLRVRQALATLSPSGRAAYRLFYDAKAKQALDVVGPAINPTQLNALRKVADQYFISSVGDQANDRLGDALFESGDFAAAAACWQAILTDFPDTSIPPLRLMTKRALALRRSGDTAGFTEAVAAIRDRFTGQSIHLGGHDVVAADYLAELPPLATTAPAQQTDNEASSQPLRLPDDAAGTLTPAWQFPLMDDATRQQIEQTLNNMGWGAMGSSVLGGPLPIDMDAKRVYVNWMSIAFALDLRTGKMVWRSDDVANQSQRVQQLIQQGQDFAGDSIAVAQDRVLLVRRDPKQNDFNGLRQLDCLSSDTGKKLWSSDDIEALKTWGFSGTPVVIGQTLYIVAHAQQPQPQQATLLAISIQDGKALWTLPLGNNTQTQNFRGMTTIADATLAARGAKLYVLTNNGALLAVDLPSHALDWAFTFAPSAPAFDPRFGFNPNFQTVTIHSQGTIKMVDSTLLIKEADNPALYAIDPTGPSLLWRRPVEASETVVHADHQGVLLVGEDLSDMDWASRELQWSAHLPGLGSGIRPILWPGHVVLFLPRGIFDMDSSDGDTLRIVRGYKHEASGGALWRSGDRLLAVSSQAITAY